MALDLSKMGQGVAIAEAERDQKRHKGFMADLFRGKANFRLLMECRHDPDSPEQKVADRMVADLKNFLEKNVNPELVEQTDELPQNVVDWLCEHGYFGMKIPAEYGGMGLHQTPYSRVIGVLASWSGGLAAPVSAASTLGLGYPIKMYGSPEQKKKWLPIVAKVPTGFAFTEAEAGSDPASMKATALRVREDGKVVGYLLNGEKLWTTNGPKSDTESLSPYLCIIAKTVDEPEELEKRASDKTYRPLFSALIVPTDAKGVRVIQRCQFEGLRGIYNGVTRFENVFVPLEDRVGAEGMGFKIALEALTTGRLSIASLCSSVAKQSVLIGKWCGNNRKQWGQNIGKHEMVGSGMLATSLADSFAMEAMAWMASNRVDRNEDARLEAAACKVFASERGWEVVDKLMQVRGGRGYETARSLAKRGEPALPVERIHRDFRINRIFEGASEILILWLLREGTDEYKKRGDVFFKPGSYGLKAKVAMGFALDMARLLVPCSVPSDVLDRVDPKLHSHLKFVEAYSRKMALAVILNSAKYQAKLIHKQLLFKRLFWIATELYGMSAACFYACPERPEGFTADRKFVALADFYCQEARIRIENLYRSLKDNSDATAREVATMLLSGNYDEWLKKDIIPITDHLGLK